MFRLRRSLVLLAVVALLAAMRPALAQQQPTLQRIASESVIEQIKSRGTLRVGQGVFVPWAMPGKDGKLIGFEVDVAKKLADDLGVELELVPTAWDGIIPALIAGKFDFIIGGLTITPKRALTINFSIPYDYAETLAVVNKKIATPDHDARAAQQPRHHVRHAARRDVGCGRQRRVPAGEAGRAR